MDARGALVAARTMAQAMDHGMTAGMTIAVSSRSSANYSLSLLSVPQSWDVRMTASVWLQEMRLVMMAESSVAG